MIMVNYAMYMIGIGLLSLSHYFNIILGKIISGCRINCGPQLKTMDWLSRSIEGRISHWSGLLILIGVAIYLPHQLKLLKNLCDTFYVNKFIILSQY